MLVDRLWPRGISKIEAIDKWMENVAPSDELRKWFNRDPKRWDEFKLRYSQKLDKNPRVQELMELSENSTVTYSAKDEETNNSIALKEYIEWKGKP